MAARNILRLGAEGPEVVQLQQLLQQLGYEMAADGVFGPDTERAIQDFQSQHGLAADGIVGPSTSEALGAELDRRMSKAPLESGVESAAQMNGAATEEPPTETPTDADSKAITSPQFLPRIDSDRIGDDDLLDITPYVNAFASLIASDSLKPPLAVGLFGDWGSGKTFFMNQLRERIENLAEHAKERRHQHEDTAFHSDIIHIEFNAWHYVEANLWASLVTHIFETLNKHFVEQEDVEKQKWERLLRKLDEALQLHNEAEEGLKKARADLESARENREEKQVKLTEVVAAVWEGLKKTDAKPELEKIERALHVEEVKQLREELTVRANEARAQYDRAELFRRTAFRGLGSTRTLLSVAAVLVAIVVVVAVLALADIEPALQTASARIAEVLGLLGGVSTWAGSALSTARSTMDAVENVETTIRDKLKADDEQAGKLRDAEEAVTTARDKVSEQEKRISDLQKQIWELRPSQRLAQFLADRAASTDYRKYLGLPALIRRDFSKLEKLMDQDIRFDVAMPDGTGHVDKKKLPELITGELKKVDTPLPDEVAVANGASNRWLITDEENGRTIEVRRDGATLRCDVKWDLPRIDRIVLYVDDLDRCPPARVVQVLQAVHLLLAFDLFVVVVGVDARWVSQSLKHHYRELWLETDRDGDSTSKPTEAEEAWVVPGYKATPHEYLEKIFQIPFWLQPMSPTATQDYIHGLLPTNELATSRSQPGDAGSADRGESEAGLETSKVVRKRRSVPLMGAVPKDEERFDEETMNPQNLRIERIERDFMDRLAPVVGRSPRAVKRFVNVYRLIRAGISPRDYDAFVGTADEPGDHQIVLLLLAIVIGAPTIAQSVFRYVDEQPANQSLSDFITKMPSAKTKAPRFKATKEWSLIEEFIKDFSKREGAGVTLEQLQAYQHRVGQYSFRVGRF